MLESSDISVEHSLQVARIYFQTNPILVVALSSDRFDRHLHISHLYATLDVPKFLFGRLSYPGQGEIENKSCAKFWDANKVYYGRCANAT